MTENTRREKLRIFVEGLRDYVQSNHPDVQMYGYGSYFEKPNKKSPGDVDGGIIMPTIITDKKVVLGISRRIAELYLQQGLSERDTQINLLDRVSSEDGRFLSYTRDYTATIEANGTGLTDDWSPRIMNGIDFKHGLLSSASHNFRIIRNSLLMSHPAIQTGRSQEKFLRSIAMLERAPRRIVSLFLFRNSKGYSELTKYFHEVDKAESLEMINEILGEEVELSVFDKLEEWKVTTEFGANPKQGLERWSQILTTYETIIGEYIKNYPPQDIQVTTRI